MALFRKVHTEFWTDVKVSEDMTPEDKLFMVYLLTNPHTTQLGVYEITPKMIAFEIGLSIESARALLERFENHHKLIKYNKLTREIAIKNWGKYNLNRGGKPIEDCLKREIDKVKDLSLIKFILEHTDHTVLKRKINLYAGFDDTSHDTSHDTLAIRDQEKEQEEKEEQEEQEEQEEKEKEEGKEQEQEPEEEKTKSKASLKPDAKSNPIPYKDILDYLNEKANKNFNPKAEGHRKLIRARWNEGYKLEDFKKVIDNKISQWLGKKSFDGKPLDQFLRPSTLFAQKHFDNYLNETVNMSNQQHGNQNVIPGFRGKMPF
ncbi:conserved phage C-terminal domain-containing protein [Bacillus cereus]|nr:conserved phage C-terminal domain-containing protein [Bacillus cereus]MEB8668086.1 conserved phage C-terminal domain-containing protein [Bacillus cereus]